MCTGYIRINDDVMEMVKPHFHGDEEIWLWVEKAVDQALKDYAQQFSSKRKDHITNELVYQKLKALEDDPMFFLKLGHVLKPSAYSADELRDEYISDKYGI